MDRQKMLDQVTFELHSLTKRIGYLAEGSGTLKCPLGRPGVYLIVMRTGWPNAGKVTAVFYDSQDTDDGAAWAADLATHLGVPLERSDSHGLHPADEEPEGTAEPEIKTIYGMEIDGDCVRASDGCWVEPDGVCEHGCPSWLIAVGAIRPRRGTLPE